MRFISYGGTQISVWCPVKLCSLAVMIISGEPTTPFFIILHYVRWNDMRELKERRTNTRNMVDSEE